MSNNYAKEVAEKIISLMEKGAGEWRREWRIAITGKPQNGKSKREYRGINKLILSLDMYAKGYTDPRFYTFKQVNEAKGKVNKGEKSTIVELFKWKTEEEKQAEFDKLGYEGCPFVIRWYRVFNAEQCTGLPAIPKFEQEWDAIEEVEKAIAKLNIKIVNDQYSECFYRPNEDTVHMTDKGAFENAHGYYATLLHEIAHATGHSSRLNRDIKYPFGSEGYAKEELRAEIASIMLCAKFGIEIGEMDENHIAYLSSWIEALKKDTNEIFKASADAEKICDFVLGKKWSEA